MQPHNDIVERSGSEQPAAPHARYAEVRSPRPENAFGYSTRFGTRPLKTHQLGREAGEALRLALAAARFSHEMLYMHVAQLGQAARDRRSTAVSPDVGYS
jgi:hypothetical protein